MCGAITFDVTLGEPEIHVCHCTICRKWAGAPALAIRCESGWEIKGEENLTWYASSERAQRGFCNTCGTHLFFKTNDGCYHGITAILDNIDDLVIGEHIFVDTKPKLYDFTDKAPRLTEHDFLKKIGVVE